MKSVSLAALVGLLVTLGAGCFDPLPQPNRPTTGPQTPQPLRGSEPDAPNPRIDVLLGLQFPAESLAVFRDSSVPKQEGALFFGQSYRLTENALEYDRLVGRLQILNLTDPYKNPRTLVDPMRALLGCGGMDIKFGPTCDFGKQATTTVNGLSILSYPVTYFPRRLNSDASTTSTVWLVPVPSNETAWVYVYPADLENPAQDQAVSTWVQNLAPLR